MAKLDALEMMRGFFATMFFSCSLGFYIIINDILLLPLLGTELLQSDYGFFGTLALITITGMIFSFIKLTINLNAIRLQGEGNKHELFYLKEKANNFRTLLSSAGSGLAFMVYWVTRYLPHYKEKSSLLIWSLSIMAFILLSVIIFISIKLFKIGNAMEPL